jgi:hypothetical protein
MFSKKYIIWFSRFSLFTIFFWFGFLKIIEVSPAENLVRNLYNVTIYNYIDFPLFCLTLGLFECFIGIIWLIPLLTRLAFYNYILHFIITFLPLFYLTEISWQYLLTPTIIGQYIIKNLCILSLVFFTYYFYKTKLYNITNKQS